MKIIHPTLQGGYVKEQEEITSVSEEKLDNGRTERTFVHIKIVRTSYTKHLSQTSSPDESVARLFFLSFLFFLPFFSSGGSFEARAIGLVNSDARIMLRSTNVPSNALILSTPI